jgi:hypothetical protein
MSALGGKIRCIRPNGSRILAVYSPVGFRASCFSIFVRIDVYPVKILKSRHRIGSEMQTYIPHFTYINILLFSLIILICMSE